MQVRNQLGDAVTLSQSKYYGDYNFKLTPAVYREVASFSCMSAMGFASPAGVQLVRQHLDARTIRHNT